MRNKNLFESEKHLLSIVFVVLFSLSFALIIAERFVGQGSGISVPLNEQNQGVRGIKIQDQTIREYRVLLKKSSDLLFSNLDHSAVNNGFYSSTEVESAYASLLALPAPAVYKDAHFALVNLSLDMLTNETDTVLLLKKKQRIVDAYPWLIQ